MLTKLLPYSKDSSNSFSDDYDLKNKIGEGTFSDVWLCVKRSNGQELAAKILKLNYGKNMDADTWNAISEVNVANSMEKHPFLLTMEEAYYEKESGRVILITELMKKSLFDIIEEGECPLPDFRVKSYMYQMLEGLKYMHENGFIHRDIKPENILLRSRDKLLKIGDFGTTCQVSKGQPFTEYVATRWYRSPECLLTRGWYGTKMDIWAAGCVLYEMATGRPLFDGRDENDQMEKIDRVLGYPDYRLINKFKKHKSNVLVNRYELSHPNDRINGGIGLHSVYQPFKPAYELLKDMIVYDPAKRYTADRLLRKSYFYDIRNTQYDYKMSVFEDMLRTKVINSLSSGEEQSSPAKDNQTLALRKQGPGGDRVRNLQTNMMQDETHKDNHSKSNAGNVYTNVQNQNQSNVLPKDITKKSRNIQISNNNYADNLKNNNPQIACPKMNMKNNIMTKNTLKPSVSTFSRVSVIKNIRPNMPIRPPFK